MAKLPHGSTLIHPQNQNFFNSRSELYSLAEAQANIALKHGLPLPKSTPLSAPSLTVATARTVRRGVRMYFEFGYILLGIVLFIWSFNELFVLRAPFELTNVFLGLFSIVLLLPTILSIIRSSRNWYFSRRLNELFKQVQYQDNIQPGRFIKAEAVEHLYQIIYTTNIDGDQVVGVHLTLEPVTLAPDERVVVVALDKQAHFLI